MRDHGEDVMVQAEDIGGADAVKAEVEAEDGTGTNLDRKASSDRLVDEQMKIKPITHDLVLKKDSFSGEDVKESVEVSKDLDQGNVLTTIASGSNDDVQKSGISVQDSGLHGEPQVDGGDIVGLDCKEPIKKGLTEEVTEQKVSVVAEVTEGDCVMDENALKGAEILDSSITTAKPSSRNNGSEDSVLAVESHSRDPQFVGEESSIDREEESEGGLSKEVMKQLMECDQEVADGDYVAEEKTVKEYEASDSSIISKLTTTNPASKDVDEGLASKNEAQAGVTERGLDTNEGEDMIVQAEDVVGADAVKAEDGTGMNLDGKTGADGLVDEQMKITHDLVLKKVSFSREDVKGSVSKDLGQGNVITTIASGCNDEMHKSIISVQDSGEPQVSVVAEVAEGDCVMNNNALKGAEILDSPIRTAKPSSRNNGTQDSVLAFGEESLIDTEEESERGLSKEMMKQPMECDQEVADGDYVVEEKIVKEYEASDSSTIPKPASKDVDVVVVVDDGLASKNEAQAGVLVCPDNRSLVTEVDNVNLHPDQQAEISNLSIKESFHPKVEDIKNNDQIPETGTGVRGSKLSVESLSREPQLERETIVIVREETERGLATNEEQFLQDNQNGGMEYQDVGFDPDKPAKARRRSNKKQRLLSNSNRETEVNEESELDQLRRQNLGTEVILKFTEGVYFSSEINLNKMFRRFGPLMESETEVDRQNGRARVVYKKRCDAEVAQSSAAQFNIFGSINVNYELNYTPLVSYKPLPLPTSQNPVDGS